MDKLALGRQISPFESCPSDIAVTLLMCHEAINQLKETWLQPPHWDHEPTREERQYEQSMIDRAEDAGEEVIRLADEIYMALTGRYPGESDDATVSERLDPDDYDIPF